MSQNTGGPASETRSRANSGRGKSWKPRLLSAEELRKQKLTRVSEYFVTKESYSDVEVEKVQQLKRRSQSGNIYHFITGCACTCGGRL